MPWHLRDLDDLHVFGWAFASGSLAGLAYLCLFQKRKPTYRLIFGSFLGSGLVGISSAVVLQIIAPDYPDLWLAASILLGLAGTHGIQFVVGLVMKTITAGSRAWLKSTKEDGDDASD